MAAALEKLPKQAYDPRVLVGYNTADDAGVIKLNDETGLVQSVDFFTPIVDDPYLYGQIAAANSLSDIYAMGGVPLSALNIVGFPKDIFPIDVLTEILRGGQDKISEAGAVILGGHTIGDDELKYGLAVTGLIHPNKIMTNANASAGDVLILTKAIGTGAITTALKNGKIDDASLNAAIAVMVQLNKIASECCMAIGVNAVTDVTGFGLLGHALEMARASRVSFEFNFADIPVIPGARQAIKKGAVPGGTKANFLYTNPDVKYAEELSQEDLWLLNDAQTSGGLLISVQDSKANVLLQQLAETGVAAAAIGVVKAGQTGKINIKQKHDNDRNH